MQVRKLATLTALTLVLTLYSGGIYANEKKPVKTNPAAGSSENTAKPSKGNDAPGASSENSGKDKVQQAIPAPTPTAQPLESVSTKTSVTSEPSKPEPSKPEPSKPEIKTESESKGTTNSSTQESNKSDSTSTQSSSKKPGSTAALSNAAVVKASDFKSFRLVPGKVSADKINSSAKSLEKKSADQSCGVEEKSANVKTGGAASAGKSNPATNKKPSVSSSNEKNNKAPEKTVEECKDYILIFSSDSTSGDIDGAAVEAKGKVLQKFSNVFKGALINGPPSKIVALAKNPKIQSIELDGFVTKQNLYTNVVWGVDRTDQRNLPLDSKYDDLGNGGYTIPVYVVDTGIYAQHNEFTGRVAAGATSINDGYGTFDCNGHGTHVAGSIAGTTFGVAKKTTLIPVRVLDCAGSGSYSGVIAGLDWIAQNHPSGVPGVVNMSLGGSASSSLDTAVNNLISQGLSVVVAAGNSGADACNYSPARVPGAITVAATSSDDRRANYSNYGSCIDVFAPGSSITSAWNSGPSGTAVASGTSMSAPHVSGVIARFLYTNPSSTPFQASNSMKQSATPDLVSNAGTNSPNLLLYFDIVFDSTSEPATSSPTTTKPSNSKKTTNPGKGNKP